LALSAQECGLPGSPKLTPMQAQCLRSIGLMSPTSGTYEKSRACRQLTLFAEAGPAKPSAAPLEVETTTPTCGRNSFGSFDLRAPVGSLLKTCLSRFMVSTGFRAICSPPGTSAMHSRSILRYQKDSGPEGGPSTWPTPTATANHCAPSMKKHPAYARLQSEHQTLTPELWEWQMGFPQGWTALDASEMPCRPKSRKSSAEQS